MSINVARCIRSKDNWKAFHSVFCKKIILKNLNLYAMVALFYWTLHHWDITKPWFSGAHMDYIEFSKEFPSSRPRTSIILCTPLWAEIWWSPKSSLYLRYPCSSHTVLVCIGCQLPIRIPSGIPSVHCFSLYATAPSQYRYENDYQNTN